jgi:biopolymer transport protein ExbB
MTAVVVRANHSGNIRRYMDDELFELTSNMSRYRTLVRTIVLVAPLAGLLGTVMGMIEMFESLGDQTFFSQTGGVANGISQALFTTQFGLVIAIPGMIVGRLLDRREGRMREEIEQIKDLLSVQEEEEEPA